MKKYLFTFLFLAIMLFSTACSKKIEKIYYSNTVVPTFTCVTNIETTTIQETELGYPIYYYSCSQSDVDEYIKYLKSEGFAEVDVQDGLRDIMTTYAKGSDARVIMSYSDDTLSLIAYRNT